MVTLGPLFECGWTLDDIRTLTEDELFVVSTLLKRWRLVKEPMTEDDLGKIVREKPELVESVNLKIEEQRRIFGSG